jgi:hypothetical protein
MTAKELKEALADVPDNALIAFDFGAYNAVEVQETEFDECQNIFYIS